MAHHTEQTSRTSPCSRQTERRRSVNARDWQTLGRRPPRRHDRATYPGAQEPIYGREVHTWAARQQLVKMFRHPRDTQEPINSEDDDWITVVTNATGNFTGERPPGGNVIPTTGKHFDLEFAQTSKWDGDHYPHLRVLGHGVSGEALGLEGKAGKALLKQYLTLGPGGLSRATRWGERRAVTRVRPARNRRATC